MASIVDILSESSLTCIDLSIRSHTTKSDNQVSTRIRTFSPVFAVISTRNSVCQRGVIIMFYLYRKGNEMQKII
jgi:hypothetical protein